MQAEFPRPEPPVDHDNTKKISSIESVLWVAIPIALLIVLAYLFWP